MDRKLATALSDLGLSATEAAIYVALLQRCQDGPITAYKLAQDLGKDPANLTKALAAMVKRGAVTAGGKRPRTYLPAQPRTFIGSLVANLQDRRDEAVTLLERIGTPADDGRPHHLETGDDALDMARQLIAEADRLVLVSAAPDWLTALQTDLDRAADERGLVVLARRTTAGPVPGPWLRLAADGAVCLSAVGRPDSDDLLHGHWSRNPAEAFLLHHDLGQAAVLDDLLELLAAGAASDAVRRRAGEQWALLGKQVPWKARWQEMGLGAYQPVEPESEELDPTAVAEAMAEVAAEFTPEMPGRERSAEAAAGASEASDDDGGALQFIFRRKRKG